MTPPIDGWVLAAGTALFRLVDSRPPEFADFVAKLSGHLGGAEVQFFSTHRVVESHAWARASHGACTRAYNFVGESCETVEDLGEPSPEETALGFAFFDERSADADDDTYWVRIPAHVITGAGELCSDQLMLIGPLSARSSH